MFEEIERQKREIRRTMRMMRILNYVILGLVILSAAVWILYLLAK